MFVDEILIEARAGDGGDGVVRWLREKARPKGGPAGGNGGRGGDVYVRAVRDMALLARYRNAKAFRAEDGEAGKSRSKYGANGADHIIDVPVGSVVTDLARGTRYELFTEGATEKILSGGNGGLGNEHFKSAVNQRPEEHTKGKPGEAGSFRIELELAADVGLVGLPNAGKSSLLNALTNASSRVGAYPFTTLDPHLGDLHGIILADIPGLIEGASAGKGLGHKFLRHVRRTRMLLHCVSLEHAEPLRAYREVRAELTAFDPAVAEKKEWLVLTKCDLVSPEACADAVRAFENLPGGEGKRVFAVSVERPETVKGLADALSRECRTP